jgi:prepilin-type N-terminal cleavage/methylation domain-containing protein/prepilin-type processing-associated H-X9-DG protein
MKNHRGFTLLEILICVALMGTLVLLIVPALKQMIDSAKSGKCIANLRASGMAILQSAQEEDGRAVLPWASASPADIASFPQLKDHPQAGLTWFQYLNQRGYLPDLRVTVCPSFFPYSYTKATGNQTMMNYGMRRPNATRYDPIVLQRVDKPSSFALIADSSKPGSWTGQNYYITAPGNRLDTFHTRHKDRANICFLDGSVRALTPDEILKLGDGWNTQAFDTNSYKTP